jgi:hypothetical protein
VLLCAGITLWHGAPLLADDLETVRDRHDRPVAERRLAPAYSVGLDPAVLRGAARELPLDARYAVVVGDTLPLPGDLDEAVTPLLNHWLFPRRRTRLDEAGWVIAYGHPTETLGVQVTGEVGIAPGVSVAQIRR